MHYHKDKHAKLPIIAAYMGAGGTFTVRPTSKWCYDMSRTGEPDEPDEMLIGNWLQYEYYDMRKQVDAGAPSQEEYSSKKAEMVSSKSPKTSAAV